MFSNLYIYWTQRFIPLSKELHQGIESELKIQTIKAINVEGLSYQV